MYLLDTNHCSSLIAKNQMIRMKLEELGTTPVATCVIVQGELRYMVEKSTHKQENEVNVNNFLSDIEIFPVDDSAADLYGKIKERIFSKFAPKQKKPMRKVSLKDMGFSDNDLWIAAIAADKGFTVVSTDSDFSRIIEAFPDLRCETWLQP